MKQILIVEPDLAAGMAFSRTFLLANYDAKHVTGGPEAIAALQQSKSSLVVLNASLGSDQAGPLLQRIRSRSDTRTLPVIAFAQSYGTRSVKEPRLQGVTESVILGKHGAEDLLKAVEQVLGIPEQPPAEPVPAISAPLDQSESPSPAPKASESQLTAEPPKHGAISSSTNPEPQKPSEQVTDRVTENAKPGDLGQAKVISQRLFCAKSGKERYPLLIELHDCVKSFTENATSVKSGVAASLSQSLTALLGRVCQQPSAATSATLRTIFQAVASLHAFLKHPSPASPLADLTFKTLAVDDQREILTLIQRSLMTVHLSSDGAEDATKALQLSQQQHYDLFVLDIMMPKIDGFELCKKLRIRPGYKDTPIIFVTGADKFDTRVRSASSGGNDFIVKPFLPSELAVRALLHLFPR